jgi:molybdenum cofactor synthesis domain-containing protein
MTPTTTGDRIADARTADARIADARRLATVVTASDGVHAGTREDASGAAVATMLEGAGFVVAREVVPDDRPAIAALLIRLADEEQRALVVVTGGTGLGPRDVTPEATRDVIEREVPGFAEAMRAAGRSVTARADLSRGVCGTRGTTLIVDLPGSPKGATESLEAVLELLPHALDLMGGDTEHAGPSAG